MKFDKKKFEFLPSIIEKEEIDVNYGVIISTETFEASVYDEDFIIIKDCVSCDSFDSAVWMKRMFEIMKSYKDGEVLNEEDEEDLRELRKEYSDRLYELYILLEAIFKSLDNSVKIDESKEKIKKDSETYKKLIDDFKYFNDTNWVISDVTNDSLEKEYFYQTFNSLRDSGALVDLFKLYGINKNS
jgi:hypothetical protein